MSVAVAAGTASPKDDRLTALTAVAGAFRRESHVLLERPGLLWQQMYNRLQWAGPPLADHLAADRERRSRPGARRWIHRYTRLRESEALVRALAGHRNSVKCCAMSPDGTWIVSASGDQTLKIWDVATGAERTTLTGHAGMVNGCAVSPDGSWIVSASLDRTLKVWDVATGAEQATLTGHAGMVNGCAVSPDGTWIVSASGDNTLKIWDAATGAERPPSLATPAGLTVVRSAPTAAGSSRPAGTTLSRSGTSPPAPRGPPSLATPAW